MPQKQEPLTSISSPLERRRPRHPILKQAYGEYAELQQLVANGPKYLRTPESEEGTGFEIMGQAGMARVKEDGSFEIKDVPGANYQLAVSDESRHFATRGMNPGGFLVLAFEEMRENYRLPEFAKRHEGRGQKVDLEQGGRKSVAVELITEEAEKP